ncbi:unnamed protein product, partial [marine sediment metagenome]
DHYGMDVAFYSMGGLNLLAFLVAILFLPGIKQGKALSYPHSSFKEMGASNMVKGLFSYRLSFALGRAAFSCFLPIFATIYMDLTPTLIGMLLAINIVLMSLIQLYSGGLADRFSRRILVVLGGIISFSFLAALPLMHNFWQLLGLCIFGAIGGSISMPAASALTVDEGRKFGMGATMAMFAVAMSIGMAIGPILGG